MADQPLVAVVLSGRAGARLWPVSREALPDTGMVLTVTNRNYYFLTRDEYSELPAGTTRFKYLIEPFGRNTAAAIATAAKIVGGRLGAGAIMLVLPADHVVADQTAFGTAVEETRSLAAAGWLVTFGVTPNRPETGYDYIKCGDRMKEGSGYAVADFVEKPDADRAAELVRSGQYLWNSGLFCFTAGAIGRAMLELCPEILEIVSVAVGAEDCGVSPIFSGSGRARISAGHLDRLCCHGAMQSCRRGRR